MSADILALLDELDAERSRPGQRCRACHKTTPEQREFLRLARERGHSFRAIARKLQSAFGLELGEGTVQNHLDNAHDPR